MSQLDIGNGLPSNSHKSQEQSELQKQKPAVPEFTGEVAGAKRKGTNKFLRWLRKMFLSDQKPSDILMNIVENQIVPGIKDNFRNSIVSSVDMFMYPNSKPTTTTNNNISYSKIYNSGQNNSLSNTTQRAQTNTDNQQDTNNGFTNPCFKNLEDRIDKDGNKIQGAKSFLALMKGYDYPTLSVHTLYMMRKRHIDYTWDAYGWTKEEIANVRIVHINNPDYPWMIDLPQAHLIA